MGKNPKWSSLIKPVRCLGIVEIPGDKGKSSEVLIAVSKETKKGGVKS